MNKKTATHIVARQIGQKAWQFGTPSILNKGTISYSRRTWTTKAGALRAGRREYGQMK